VADELRLRELAVVRIREREHAAVRPARAAPELALPFAPLARLERLSGESRDRGVGLGPKRCLLERPQRLPGAVELSALREERALRPLQARDAVGERARLLGVARDRERGDQARAVANPGVAILERPADRIPGAAPVLAAAEQNHRRGAQRVL